MASDHPHRVLITGAAGLVGRVLRGGLSSEFALSGLDVARGEGVDSVADLAKGGRRVRRAFRDRDAVIDLAADPRVSTPWDRVLRNNLAATVNVFEAAREAGVERVIFASSNHVTGLYEREEPYARIVSGDYKGLDPARIPMLRASDPVKPDGPYGVGKAFGEAVGRYYAEAHDLSVICLRIGSCNRSDRPENDREFATLLTHADLVRLVECSLRAPRHVRYAVYFGVSNNTWRFWDLAPAREQIGYEPRDDAEAWRPSAPAQS
jgi:nucleoside-diphosphate-sugar epimerase